MQPALNACVYIVDDDAIVRDAMAWLLRSRRLMSESFDSADAFEHMLNDTFPGPNAPVPTQAGLSLIHI
jgi:two-component system response regulator DctR